MRVENGGNIGADGRRVWFLLVASVVGAVVAVLSACRGGRPAPGDGAASSPAREFAIEGMTCQGCVETVTEALAKLPGIEHVEVSLQDKRARVVADASIVPDSAIETAVAEAGYQARAMASRLATPPTPENP